MHRCNTREEFLEALTLELETDSPGVFPGDWTGYLSRCLHWRDEGGEHIHDECADQGDYNSLEKELEEAQTKIEGLEKDLEDKQCEVETLNDRLLAYEDTDPPPPDQLRAAMREAVASMRSLFLQLDAPKPTPTVCKRVRTLLATAADALEAATRKDETEDLSLPGDHEPAAPWQTAEYRDGESVIPFRWQRTPIRTPGGATTGAVTHIAWTPVEGVGAEVAISRWWGGEFMATLQVWQHGEEVTPDDEDRDTLHEQARALEACLPEA